MAAIKSVKIICFATKTVDEIDHEAEVTVTNTSVNYANVKSFIVNALRCFYGICVTLLWEIFFLSRSQVFDLLLKLCCHEQKPFFLRL
jgi:hypothetical protein